MLRREALNVAGVCDQDDRFNCKYCRRAGRDCEGATSVHRRFPDPGWLGYSAFMAAAELAREGSRRFVREEVIEWDEPPYYTNERGFAIQMPGPMRHVTLWRYHYSDGTSEDVIKRGSIS